MSPYTKIVWLATVLLVTGVAGAVTADQLPRHSGTVMTTDAAANTFVLAEVGPWRLSRGETVITRRDIVVTPETEFFLVHRADQAPSGFARDFVVESLILWGVGGGDFVTVECRHEGERMIATKVYVVDVAEERR